MMERAAAIPAVGVMAEYADGLPMPQRIWANLTIGLGLILAVLDGADPRRPG
ncbi:MAG: hypothetical protein ACREF3_02325 [Acetobacteraceae bacterium]